MPVQTVFIVSDSLGETGEFVVRAAVTQFQPVKFDIRRQPFVSDEAAIDRVIHLAQKVNAIIAFTLVIPELRDYLIREAQENELIYVDLLGPIIANLEKVLGKESRNKPGMLHLLNEDYFKKVDAIEFSVKYDDGKDPKGILTGDIVLVGVSRTSKTPLSMYLANKKFKVANVPLVPELIPPDELFAIPKEKIVGLTINTEKLNAIRKERLKALGLTADASYAQIDRIRQELKFSDEIMKRLGCRVIDVSNKAVEETASLIIDMFQMES